MIHLLAEVASPTGNLVSVVLASLASATGFMAWRTSRNAEKNLRDKLVNIQLNLDGRLTELLEVTKKAAAAEALALGISQGVAQGLAQARAQGVLEGIQQEKSADKSVSG